MSTIQVRTNGTTKKKAQKILKTMGMDLSTAINLYLVKIVVTESIPFPITLRLTPKRERQLLKEVEWAKKYGKRYTSTKEMFEDILRE